MQAKIDLENSEQVYNFVKDLNIDLKETDSGSNVIINGQNVNNFIRTPEVTRNVALVAKIQKVRDQILPLQVRLGNDEKVKGVVCEGRDIGTVVFPDANLKIYLIADPKVRAERRVKQQNNLAEYQEVLKEIIERDFHDMNRVVAPLKKADDAVEVDTSQMTLDDQVQFIVNLVKQKMSSDQ